MGAAWSMHREIDKAAEPHFAPLADRRLGGLLLVPSCQIGQILGRFPRFSVSEDDDRLRRGRRSAASPKLNAAANRARSGGVLAGVTSQRHRSADGGQRCVNADWRQNPRKCQFGWVAEWSKAAVLKTAVRATVPGVRIPPHPLARTRSVPHRPGPKAARSGPSRLNRSHGLQVGCRANQPGRVIARRAENGLGCMAEGMHRRPVPSTRGLFRNVSIRRLRQQTVDY
jgi:hypothetical protein